MQQAKKNVSLSSQKRLCCLRYSSNIGFFVAPFVQKKLLIPRLFHACEDHYKNIRTHNIFEAETTKHAIKIDMFIYENFITKIIFVARKGVVCVYSGSIFWEFNCHSKPLVVELLAKTSFLRTFYFNPNFNQRKHLL